MGCFYMTNTKELCWLQLYKKSITIYYQFSLLLFSVRLLMFSFLEIYIDA